MATITALRAGASLALLALLGACSGTEHRKLLITEVGSNRIELYLDEAPNRALTLGSGGQQGTVPGIKVATGFMGDIRSSQGEVRLAGSRNRVSGLLAIFPLFTKDVVDDVVRFGLPQVDRPETGGDFIADGSLGNPTGSAHLQRRWNGAAPLDTDHETDWLGFGQSWGAPTP